MATYRKLVNQPLVFALAEFRFSPVFKIAQFIPDLQDAMRKTYPLPEVLQEHSIQVQAGGVAINAKERWAFVSSDRRSTVTVDQDRLIYFTTNYPRFDGFAKECLTALAHLKRVVSPELLLRIGLRYGDCIQIGAGERLEEYVDEYFGYPKLAEPLGQPVHQRDEVGIKTNIGRLLIRSFYGDHAYRCMPDIQGIPGVPSNDNEPSERILLDFDHFWSAGEASVGLDLDLIESLLDQLHETSRDAFWRITTNKAKDEKWA